MFYRDCKARLSKQGVLALNLFGRSRGYARQMDALNDVFQHRVLSLGANDEGNAVAFAFAGERLLLDLPTIEDALALLARDTGIKWGKSLVRLRGALSSHADW